ncbi:MAG: ABC transporter permease [Phycisphaerales bacterium]
MSALAQAWTPPRAGARRARSTRAPWRTLFAKDLRLAAPVVVPGAAAVAMVAAYQLALPWIDGFAGESPQWASLQPWGDRLVLAAQFAAFATLVVAPTAAWLIGSGDRARGGAMLAATQPHGRAVRLCSKIGAALAVNVAWIALAMALSLAVSTPGTKIGLGLRSETIVTLPNITMLLAASTIGSLWALGISASMRSHALGISASIAVPAGILVLLVVGSVASRDAAREVVLRATGYGPGVAWLEAERRLNLAAEPERAHAPFRAAAAVWNDSSPGFRSLEVTALWDQADRWLPACLALLAAGAIGTWMARRALTGASAEFRGRMPPIAAMCMIAPLATAVLALLLPALELRGDEGRLARLQELETQGAHYAQMMQAAPEVLVEAELQSRTQRRFPFDAESPARLALRERLMSDPVGVRDATLRVARDPSFRFSTRLEAAAFLGHAPMAEIGLELLLHSSDPERRMQGVRALAVADLIPDELRVSRRALGTMGEIELPRFSWKLRSAEAERNYIPSIRARALSFVVRLHRYLQEHPDGGAFWAAMGTPSRVTPSELAEAARILRCPLPELAKWHDHASREDERKLVTWDGARAVQFAISREDNQRIREAVIAEFRGPIAERFDPAATDPVFLEPCSPDAPAGEVHP